MQDHSYHSRFLSSVETDTRMEIVKCFIGIHVVALLNTSSYYDLGDQFRIFSTKQTRLITRSLQGEKKGSERREGGKTRKIR